MAQMRSFEQFVGDVATGFEESKGPLAHHTIMQQPRVQVAQVSHAGVAIGTDARTR